MKPASVIIMDEYPIVRMSIEVLLEKNQNVKVVLKTDDSRAALDYIRTLPVDLVILDIELPKTDGFTLLRRIKAIQEDVNVLFYHQNLNRSMLQEPFALALMVLSVSGKSSTIFITP